MKNEEWKIGNGSTPDGYLIVNQAGEVVAHVYGATEAEAKARALMMAAAPALRSALFTLFRHRCFDHADACCSAWCDKCQRESAAVSGALHMLSITQGDDDDPLPA